MLSINICKSRSSIRMNFNVKLYYSREYKWVIFDDHDGGGDGVVDCICQCRSPDRWDCVSPHTGTLSPASAGRLGSVGSSSSAWRWLCPLSSPEPPQPLSSFVSSSPGKTCLLEETKKSSDSFRRWCRRNQHCHRRPLLFPEISKIRWDSEQIEMWRRELLIQVDERRMIWAIYSRTSRPVSPQVYSDHL